MLQVDKHLYMRHNMPTEPLTLSSFLPKIDIPSVSLHKYLLEKLDKYSDQYLIECETNTSFTFYELENVSRRMANVWLSLGLKEGNVFGVFGENCFQYLAIYLGGIIAGGIASGIASTDTFQEVSDKIIQRNIKYLAVSDKNISIAKKISEGIPITQKIIVFNGRNKVNNKFEIYSELIDSQEPISDDMIYLPNDMKQDECLILNTSGSLSPPKTLVFSHYSIVSAIEVTSLPQIFGYTLSEVISSHSELDNQISIFQIFTGIATGSKIALMPCFEQKSFVNYVKSFKISAAILSSSAIISLLKETENCEIISLTKVISCGSVLPKTIANQFLNRFNHIKDLRQGLFVTECMAPVTMMIKNYPEYDSIGVPTPNTRVIIKDRETNEQLAANQIGVICVQRENGLTKGYLHNRVVIRPLYDSDHWFHTRDLGYYDDDRLLYMVGNIDEIIKSDNSLIPSIELECLLLSHTAVAEAAVIGVAHESYGQIPIGFVVLKPEFIGKVYANEIEVFVNNQLTKKRRLHSIHVLSRLPKTIFGKIIKRQLRNELKFRISKQKF